MRIVSWNMRRATAASAAWDYLQELDPDVALLQEVAAFPESVLSQWTAISESAMGKTGSEQRFKTVILVRGGELKPLELSSDRTWVQAELERFRGNLVARMFTPDIGPEIALVSVYSPAWPIDPLRLAGHDLAGVKLPTNPNVWLTDVMLAGLPEPAGLPWIVGGDFNLSETFDARRPWAGNAEFLARMSAHGYVECLRHATGQLTPTFRNPRGGAVIHQMDHVFVSDPLLERLETCAIGDADRVFGLSLSDHLPIVADVSTGASTSATRLPQSMSYFAQHRVQIKSDPDPRVAGELRVHEDNGAGEPLCGRRNLPWNGQPMYLVRFGPGTVSCGLCARSHYSSTCR